MVLCRMTRAYLLRSDNGRLLGGNSVASARAGLAGSAAVRDFFGAAHAKFMGGPTRTIAAFENAMSESRFGPNRSDGSKAVLDAGLGFADANDPPLWNQNVYHVMNLKYLHGLVDRDSELHTEIGLPLDEAPDRPAQFLSAWNSLAPEKRRFSLDNFLGRPIVWFTTEAGAMAARAYGAANGLNDADAFCEALGLGHHAQGEWMVLLQIPGNAVQRAQHYRPLFCDAVTHRYFMLNSSIAGSRASVWGQTANLAEARLRAGNYDGCPERVAHQIAPGHLEDDEFIHVELLGPLDRPSYPGPAPDYLANGVWARRRAR